MKTLYYLADDPHYILNYVTKEGRDRRGYPQVQVAFNQYKRVSMAEVFERRKNNHDLRIGTQQRIRERQNEAHA